MLGTARVGQGEGGAPPTPETHTRRTQALYPSVSHTPHAVSLHNPNPPWARHTLLYSTTQTLPRPHPFVSPSASAGAARRGDRDARSEPGEDVALPEAPGEGPKRRLSRAVA